MKKETAVEWLDNELWGLKLKLRGGEISLDFYFEQQIKLINQAKEMEKEQIMEAHIAGMEFIAVHPNKYVEDAEQYYNETYKKEEKCLQNENE
jgi:hypothetical protein